MKQGEDGYIHFRCKECGHKLFVKTEWQGRRGKCPACGSPITMPVLEERPEERQEGR